MFYRTGWSTVAKVNHWVASLLKTTTKDPIPTFNLVFENQPIAWGILTQPSRYKKSRKHLLADEKGPQQRDPGSCLVIYLDEFTLLKKGLLVIIIKTITTVFQQLK